MRALALLAALAGCSQIFNLDEGVAPDASGDASGDASDDASGPGVVHGTLVAQVLQNGSDGRPLVDVLDPPAGPLHVTLEDGVTTDVPLDSVGAFQFETPYEGARYRLDLNRTIRTEVQLAASELMIPQTTIGRIGSLPAGMGTTLTFSMGGAPMGSQSDYIASTGRYSFLRTNAASVDWTTMASLNSDGGVGLLDSSQGDRVYHLRYFGGSGVLVLARAIEGALQMKNTTNVVFAAPLDLPQGCTMFSADRQSMAQALMTTNAGWSAPKANWAIMAVPAPALGLAGGQLIAFTADEPTPAEVSFQVTYVNPFPGTTLLAYTTVYVTRMYQQEGAKPLVVPAEYRAIEVVPISTVGGCPSVELVPATVRVADDVFIGTTNLSVPPGVVPEVTLPPMGPVVVTWAADDPDPVPAYTVLVQKLKAELVGGELTTRLDPLMALLTDRAQIELPRDLFQPGVQYVIAIAASTGDDTPGVIDSVQYPLTSTLNWTAPFRVMP